MAEQCENTDSCECENTTWLGAFFRIVVVGTWVCGIAVAKGFWATLGSVLLPPVAWVMLAGHFLN